MPESIDTKPSSPSFFLYFFPTVQVCETQHYLKVQDEKNMSGVLVLAVCDFVEDTYAGVSCGLLKWTFYHDMERLCGTCNC
jgi:hypothetical protein